MGGSIKVLKKVEHSGRNGEDTAVWLKTKAHWRNWLFLKLVLWLCWEWGMEQIWGICVLIFNILQLMWECCQPIQSCIGVLRCIFHSPSPRHLLYFALPSLNSALVTPQILPESRPLFPVLGKDHLKTWLGWVPHPFLFRKGWSAREFAVVNLVCTAWGETDCLYLVTFAKFTLFFYVFRKLFSLWYWWKVSKCQLNYQTSPALPP